jgi:hypothetical protein
MPDLSWLGDVAKVAGGTVIGAVGKTLADRNKKRLMRRHLYRELGANYERVVWMLRELEAPSFRQIGSVSLEYYTFAIRDMSTYYGLTEHDAISELYDVLRQIDDSTRLHQPELTSRHCTWFCLLLASSLSIKRLDTSLLLRSVPPAEREALRINASRTLWFNAAE